MKNFKLILLSLILLVGLSLPVFAQTPTNPKPTKQGQLITLDIPLSLAKSATYYSVEFSLDGYLSFDSTKFFTVLWQSNDTVQVKIALQVVNKTAYTSTSYLGTYQTVATITPGTTSQLNAGNDTLYAMNVYQRGTVASGVTDGVSMSGKIGDTGRLVVTFANPTTVGNSGQFRMWAYLPKR